MKRAIAIDTIADQEPLAAERLLSELQVAAPGTPPMIEAQAAHTYTQPRQPAIGSDTCVAF